MKCVKMPGAGNLKIRMDIVNKGSPLHKRSPKKFLTAKGKFHRLIFDLLQIVNLESK